MCPQAREGTDTRHKSRVARGKHSHRAAESQESPGGRFCTGGAGVCVWSGHYWGGQWAVSSSVKGVELGGQKETRFKEPGTPAGMF